MCPAVRGAGACAGAARRARVPSPRHGAHPVPPNALPRSDANGSRHLPRCSGGVARALPAGPARPYGAPPPGGGRPRRAVVAPWTQDAAQRLVDWQVESPRTPQDKVEANVTGFLRRPERKAARVREWTTGAAEWGQTRSALDWFDGCSAAAGSTGLAVPAADGADAAPVQPESR
ncbi:hypothetical protein GCM10010247_67610 [Streptomyces calvus]|nr:hypothetical protein GCM10010247_67610 [Streptomyces calvus]